MSEFGQIAVTVAAVLVGYVIGILQCRSAIRDALARLDERGGRR